MVGRAKELIEELDKCETTEEAYKLMKETFANEELAHRYKAELRNRRRKPGESLDDLRSDIKRLMKLAYPGQANTKQYEKDSRDFFINSFPDKEFRKGLRAQKCETLQKAFIEASSMIAYDEEDSMKDDAKFATSKVRLVEDRVRAEAQEHSLNAQEYAKAMEMLIKKRDEEMIKENKKRDEEIKKREDQMMTQFKAIFIVS